MDETILPSANSLANYALRDIVRAGNLRSRVIDSPRVRHANLMRKPMVLFVNRGSRIVAALYAVKASAVQLFREQTPSTRLLREHWQDYARAYVQFEISKTGAVEIQAAGFTIRAARELLKPFHEPLSAVERSALLALLSSPSEERRVA